ncbi:MAG: cyclopropane-fatty-acyl-phospholipid synthase family protein [Gemmataceae bacterium]
MVTSTTAASLRFLSSLLEDYPARDIAVRAWDGQVWQPAAPPSLTIVLRHPAAARRMFSPPKMLTLCEAYLYGDIDLEGDVETFWSLVEHLFVSGAAKGRLTRKAVERGLAGVPEGGPERAGRQAPKMAGEFSSLARDREAIASHYDVSNDFYALWLDKRMVYSCAYFATGDETIEQAQEQKLEHICRKLRLKPGDRLLDVGCGWGGLIRHAAERYGVEATGITISAAQAEGARERIQKAGLASRCKVELCDYRQLQGEGRFDKVVSVGMFEHVPEGMLPTYFAQAWKLLKPGGVFLNHAISLHVGPVMPIGTQFVYLYIFPDSQLQAVSATLNVAEKAGFEVRDVECLREHYELTTRHWLRRLEEREAEAKAVTSELTYRVYRLYLAMSARSFRIGQPSIHQSLLSKPLDGRSGLPLTRADWYAPRPALRISDAA